jgi:hypothetical protein
VDPSTEAVLGRIRDSGVPVQWSEEFEDGRRVTVDIGRYFAASGKIRSGKVRTGFVGLARALQDAGGAVEGVVVNAGEIPGDVQYTYRLGDAYIGNNGRIFFPNGRLGASGDKARKRVETPIGYEPEFDPANAINSRRGDDYGRMSAYVAMAAAIRGFSPERQQALSERSRRLTDSQLADAWADDTGVPDGWVRYQKWAGVMIPSAVKAEPVRAMAYVYGYAKMGGHVPPDVRRMYRETMGESALPLPEFSTKRPENV